MADTYDEDTGDTALLLINMPTSEDISSNVHSAVARDAPVRVAVEARASGRSELTVEDAASARAFLLRLVGALTQLGAPSSLVEHLGHRAARGMLLRMDVVAFPNWFIARTSRDLENAAGTTFDPADAVTMHTVTSGLDVHRLEECDQLARDAATGRLTPQAADARLIAIVSQKALYPLWVQQLAYGWCGTSCALLFYGGSYEDALFATIGGLITGLLCHLASLYNMGSSLEFVCSLAIAALNRAVITYVWPDRMCFFASSLGALVWLFPGLGILNAILDIAGSSSISGTARMFHSLLVMLMIGFGLSIGSRIGNLGQRITSYSCDSDDSRNWYTLVLAFVGCSLAYAVLMNLGIRQIPGAMLTQSAAYVIGAYAPDAFGFEAGLVLASASVGLVANIWGWIFKRPAYTNVVSGVVFLLPGAMGIRGATAIVEDDYVSATAFGSTMLIGTLSITIGLTLAHTATAPLRGSQVLRKSFRWFMRPVVRLQAIAAKVQQFRPSSSQVRTTASPAAKQSLSPGQSPIYE